MNKLIIKGVLPSMNEIVGANRANRFMGGKQKKEYDNLVILSCRASKLKKITGLNDYKFTWYCKDKRKDKDNIMAGQKFVFDGLQKAGIIDNDGWNNVGDIIHRFRIDKENPRVEIEIEEIENDR